MRTVPSQISIEKEGKERDERLADEKKAKEAARLAYRAEDQGDAGGASEADGAEVQPGLDQNLPQYIEQTGGGDDEEDEDEEEDEDG